MAYQVIARKWRPQSFAEVTGQEPITRTLSNAIEHERLHHAYLFSGARGVGKTTLLLQYLKQNFYTNNQAFYFSADNIYFNEHSQLDDAHDGPSDPDETLPECSPPWLV